MCIAGPGSGKTLTIVNRLAEMLDTYNIFPPSVLVVTFTRAAAVSMRKRFISHYGEDGGRVNFGTFHSIFFHILSQSNGYKKENIIDDLTSFKLMQSILEGRKLTLSGNPEFIRQVLDEISKFKASRQNISEFSPLSMSKKDFSSVFTSYQQYLHEMNLVDFEDMMNCTYDLLTENQDILKFWQKKFQYILIDEFQDINPIQYDIIRLLAAPENNIFAVGDDDQSVYSFRGAAPDLMRKFTQEYNGTKIITLDINYRCSGKIVEASQRLIQNNHNRFKKDLKPFKPAGHDIVIKRFSSSRDEYTHLCRLISAKLDSGVSPDEIAVLYRTNAQSTSFCQYFINFNIPFRTKGYIPCIYDNRYISPIIAYLRYLAGDNSRSNFLLFCNKPVRYISRDMLTDEKIDLYDLISRAEHDEKYYLAGNLKKLISDCSIMQRLGTSAAIHYIRKVVGYDMFLKQSVNLSGSLYEETIDLLDELENDASSYKSITAYLNHISEYKEKLTEYQNSFPVSAVNMLTFHGCKGLEYEYVYIPDCVEGITPHRLSQSDAETEEERRMFYVAATRAKSELYFSYSTNRQGHSDTKCSRFIKEIQNIKSVSTGQNIYHTKYKSGKVLSVDGDAFIVKFDSLMVPKKLSLSYCIEHDLIE